MIRFASVVLAVLIIIGLSLPQMPRSTALAEPDKEYASTNVRIGDVSTIVADPHNPAIFYALASGRGVFESTDGAETWKSIGGGITSSVVFRKLLVDPQRPNIIYIEGDTSLLKSTDGGASWIPIDADLGDRSFLGFAMSPVDPSVLYVASQHKIFETVDGGQTWEVISSNLERGPFRLMIDPKNPTVLYGFSDLRLMKSTDAGVHWNKIGPRVPSHDITAFAMSPADDSVLFIGTQKHGIYESTNAGKNWSAHNSGLLTKNMNEVQGDIPRVWAIAGDPSDPKTIYAGVSADLTGGMTASVFKSSNSGKSWRLMQTIGRATGSYGVTCLLVDPFDGNVVFAGADGDGVYKSIDGGVNWSPQDGDLSTADVVAFVIGKSDGALYAATEEGVFHFEGHRWRQVGFNYRDFGKQWVNSIAVDPKNSATVYVGTRSSYDSMHSGLFKTTDGGGTWSEVDSALPISEGSVSALSIDSSESSTAYVAMFSTGFILPSSAASGVKSAEKSGISTDVVIPSTADPSLSSAIFKTTNGGKDWESWSSGIPRHEMSVTDMFHVPQDAATLYALTPPFVWKLTMGASTWVPAAKLPAAPAPRLILHSPPFAISPSKPLQMYSANFSIEDGKAKSKVFESNDGGLNWFPTGNAGEIPIDHLAVDPRNPSMIYAGGRDGVLKSTDGGRTWTGMNSGLPHPVKPLLGFQSKARVTGLALDPSDNGTIYLTTGGRGVFESADGGITWHSKPAY